jgi:hypothetical protein
MSDRMRPSRALVAALITAAAAVATVGGSIDASAAGDKVPEADKIRKRIERLYNGETNLDSAADKEKIYIEIDSILKQDKKGLALRAPDFWADAVQEGRFPGSKKLKLGKTKTVVLEDLEIDARDGKKSKAKIAYRAGSFVKAAASCPLILAILERGEDPKAYVETTWPAADEKGAPTEIGKTWVVAAMSIADEFPADKDPLLVVQPFLYLWNKYPLDMNRWYLEATGNACEPVQTFAANNFSTRLAGLVLRGPSKPVTTSNSACFPALVVYSETSKEGPVVFEAYKALEANKKAEEKFNEELKLADVPSVKAKSDQIIAWLGRHPKRQWLKDATYVATISDTEGEKWNGSFYIEVPAKRGQPTKVSVKYLRDSNTVDIQCDNLGQFTVYMNDELLDLDKEVAIFVNGTQVEKKVFDRNYRTMFELADAVGEYGHMFLAKYPGVVSSKIAAPPPAAGPEAQPPAGGNQPPGGNPPPGGNAPPK